MRKLWFGGKKGFVLEAKEQGLVWRLKRGFGLEAKEEGLVWRQKRVWFGV